MQCLDCRGETPTVGTRLSKMAMEIPNRFPYEMICQCRMCMDFRMFHFRCCMLLCWRVSYFPHDGPFLSKPRQRTRCLAMKAKHPTLSTCFAMFAIPYFKERVSQALETGALVSISQVPAYMTIFNLVRNQYFFLGEEILSAMPMAAIKLVSALLLIEMAEPGSEGH